jgi:hypothetical protein
MIDVRRRDARRLEAVRDGPVGESGFVLLPGEPFLFNGSHEVAVDQQGRGGAGVIRVDSQDDGQGSPRCRPDAMAGSFYVDGPSTPESGLAAYLVDPDDQ